MKRMSIFHPQRDPSRGLNPRKQKVTTTAGNSQFIVSGIINYLREEHDLLAMPTATPFMSGFVIVPRGITRALTHPLQSVCGSYDWEAIFRIVRGVAGNGVNGVPCAPAIYLRLERAYRRYVIAREMNVEAVLRGCTAHCIRRHILERKMSIFAKREGRSK